MTALGVGLLVYIYSFFVHISSMQACNFQLEHIHIQRTPLAFS